MSVTTLAPRLHAPARAHTPLLTTPLACARTAAPLTRTLPERPKRAPRATAARCSAPAEVDQAPQRTDDGVGGEEETFKCRVCAARKPRDEFPAQLSRRPTCKACRAFAAKARKLGWSLDAIKAAEDAGTLESTMLATGYKPRHLNFEITACTLCGGELAGDIKYRCNPCALASTKARSLGWPQDRIKAAATAGTLLSDLKALGYTPRDRASVGQEGVDTATHQRCSLCCAVRPRSRFTSHQGRITGLAYNCRNCDLIQARALRIGLLRAQVKDLIEAGEASTVPGLMLPYMQAELDACLAGTADDDADDDAASRAIAPAPDGQLRCKQCHVCKDAAEFTVREVEALLSNDAARRPLVCITCKRINRRARRDGLSAEAIAVAVAAAAAAAPPPPPSETAAEKQCLLCTRTRALHHFGHSVGMAHGRAQYCRPCDRLIARAAHLPTSVKVPQLREHIAAGTLDAMPGLRVPPDFVPPPPEKAYTDRLTQRSRRAERSAAGGTGAARSGTSGSAAAAAETAPVDAAAAP